jgi:hypothetical protein
MAGYLGAQGGMKVPKFTFRKSDRLSTSRDKLTASGGGEVLDSLKSSHRLNHSADVSSPSRSPRKLSFGRDDGPVLLDNDDDFGYQSPFAAPPSQRKSGLDDDNDGYRSPFSSSSRKSDAVNRSATVPTLNISSTLNDIAQHSTSASATRSAVSSARSSPPQTETDCYQVNFYRNGELVAEPKLDPILSTFNWVGNNRWSDRTFSRSEICDVFRDLCVTLKQQLDCPVIMPDTFGMTSGSSMTRGPIGYGDFSSSKHSRPHPDDDDHLRSDSPRIPNSVQDYNDLLL